MIQRVEAGRELTQAALSDLCGALAELIANGVTTIYLDTSRVVEFDSHSLEAVLEFDALARSRGLAVAVVRPSEIFGTALKITGLWERLEIREIQEGVADAGVEAANLAAASPPSEQEPATTDTNAPKKTVDVHR